MIITLPLLLFFLFISFNLVLWIYAPSLIIPKFFVFIFSFLEISFFISMAFLFLSFKSYFLKNASLIILVFLTTSVILIYMAQGYSVYLTGYYINRLALENITEINYIINYKITLLIGFGALSALGLAFLLSRLLPTLKWAPRARYGMVGIIVSVGLVWLVQSNTSWRAPITSFVSVSYSTWKPVSWTPDVDSDFHRMAGATLSRSYPLMRQGLGAPMLPFERLRQEDVNVIVIFAEGLSSRIMRSYGGSYSDLTPNLDSFANKSMRIDNYFNHTAATFRGLQGTLISGYPYFGGAMRGGWMSENEPDIDRLTSVRYRTLTSILQENEFHTTFISPHSNTNALNSMLRALDFDSVYAFDDYERMLGSPRIPHPEVSGAATDEDVFAMTYEVLENYSEDDVTRPFFLSMYNIGTHAFINSMPGGLRYDDGHNPALNRFHEFDRVWGEFLECFRQSPLAANTMLVLTTDHAMFHEQPVLAAFGDDDYQGYFVDTIPLLIHAPQWDLPEVWDARNSSSLDLAPTLLHLLGFDDICHAFLGRSIFDSDAQSPVSMAAMSDDFYYLGEWGVATQLPDSERNFFTEKLQIIRSFYALERSDRLFNMDYCEI